VPDRYQEELLCLHTALCSDDDPTAPARLASLLLPALRRRFGNKPDGGDPHLLDSLIDESVARYLQEPGRYDPTKGPLLAYLYQDVEGDRKNALAGLARRRLRESPAIEVELSSAGGNLSVEQEVLDGVDPFDVSLAALDAARAELASFSELDRRLLDLLGQGVRETAPYAEVLGIGHLPVALQRRAAKRHKDRLKARLEVIRERLGLR
jgi:hypothetical protein